MTALNMWHDGINAYILNDTSVTAGDGTVISFSSKTITIAGMSIAIGLTGLPIMDPLMSEIERLQATHPADVISQLPRLVQEADAQMSRHLPENYDGPNCIGLAAAVYDHEQGRPLCFLTGSNHDFLPDALEPFSLTQVHFWLTGNGSYGPFDPAGDFRGVENFQPEVDGLAMIESQRREVFDCGHYRIGGEAILTTLR